MGLEFANVNISDLFIANKGNVGWKNVVVANLKKLILTIANLDRRLMPGWMNTTIRLTKPFKQTAQASIDNQRNEAAA